VTDDQGCVMPHAAFQRADFVFAVILCLMATSC
jgi:hypothetical protein